jgi:hypothetical protein
MNANGWKMIIVGGLVLLGPRFLEGQTINPDQKVTLTRNYVEGEKISYQMKAINEGHVSTICYEAQANARVEREPSGHLVEVFTWTGLLVNGQTVLCRQKNPSSRISMRTQLRKV